MRLVQTCGGCPEQYDLFDGDGILIGYLRLRHGYFRAEAVQFSEKEPVYEASTYGDGSFKEEERPEHLAKAISAIVNYYKNKKNNDDNNENCYTDDLEHNLNWKLSEYGDFDEVKVQLYQYDS